MAVQVYMNAAFFAAIALILSEPIEGILAVIQHKGLE